MKQNNINMSSGDEKKVQESAGSKPDERQFNFDPKISDSSLPDLLAERVGLCNSESGSPTESDRDAKNSPRLVQHCGPDCMITQRIVDRLLSRMLALENERSELLAANRSWAVQFQFMKERYEGQIKKLEEKLRSSRKTSESSRQSVSRSEKAPNPLPSSPCPVNHGKLGLLTHQAEVYKQDFLQERKERVRAHAQIEVLRNELKRERKSRVQPSYYPPQNDDDTHPVFN